jgi:hypothetical protein
VTHLDEELLAQWALEGSDPEPEAAEHLATCPDCQATFAELRALTADLHQTPDLATPAGHVWDRIASDLDLAPAAVSAGPRPGGTGPTGAGGDQTGPTQVRAGAPGGDQPGTAHAGGDEGRRRRYGRGVLALAAGVAAILGIGIGLGTATFLDRDDPSPTPPPVAVVRLEPLPGKTGGGTADLIQSGNELQVSVTGLEASTGYYELWLINSDGERMVSLGVLDPTEGGTFRIPDNATSEGYRIVDISLEPNDGNPAHSRDSVVRGTLPS